MRLRWKIFADKYLECWNATEAYKFAYPKAKDTSAATNAGKLLRNAEISAYIDAQIDEIMPKGEVLKRLADEARGDDKQTRIKALELLGKKHKLFTEKFEGSVSATVSWAEFISD